METAGKHISQASLTEFFSYSGEQTVMDHVQSKSHSSHELITDNTNLSVIPEQLKVYRCIFPS